MSFWEAWGNSVQSEDKAGLASQPRAPAVKPAKSERIRSETAPRGKPVKTAKAAAAEEESDDDIMVEEGGCLKETRVGQSVLEG